MEIIYDRNYFVIAVKHWLLCLQLFAIVFTVFLLLFVHCGSINTLTVVCIYVCCNELYAHCFPRESMVRGSAAQTVDGKLRV